MTRGEDGTYEVNRHELARREDTVVPTVYITSLDLRVYGCWRW
jgi:hypothetical protein